MDEIVYWTALSNYIHVCSKDCHDTVHGRSMLRSPWKVPGFLACSMVASSASKPRWGALQRCAGQVLKFQSSPGSLWATHIIWRLSCWCTAGHLLGAGRVWHTGRHPCRICHWQNGCHPRHSEGDRRSAWVPSDCLWQAVQPGRL